MVSTLIPWNNIHLLFLPLFKKSYTDEERQKIIADNDHHTDKTMRRLLLSIPAAGTSTGKLFIQIECQAIHEWLLCCFYSIDATKVTLHLSQLSDLLTKYVHADSLGKLFKEEYNLKSVAKLPL